MKKLTIIFAISALMIWAACNKETEGNLHSSVPILPDNYYTYVPADAPDWILNSIAPTGPQPAPDIEHSWSIKVTDAGATLGRVLFYDKALSLNNNVSCGSCHKQQFGFADPIAFSNGLMPSPTKRNSMHIVNVFSSTNLFWDGRASDLKAMVLMPVQDHIEMGFENIDNLPKKLEQLDYYPELFKAAFGDESITNDKISFALTEFVKSLVSYNSRYDMYNRGAGSLTGLELEGLRLFTEKYDCASCHNEPNFGAGYYGGVANIGLDRSYVDKGAELTLFDPIFFDVFGNNIDLPLPPFNPDEVTQRSVEGAFKIPSLRNIVLTRPYMHDGRFATLEEVIEHYATGVKPHPDLDWRMQDFRDGSATITDLEKQALVAFLKSLTDYTFLSEPRFSDPFVKQ